MIKSILKITSSPAFADALSDQISSSVTDITNQQNLEGVVNTLVKISIPMGVLAAVGLMVYAAFIMISSQGNPEKLTEAREVATNAIIGFALVALSVAILLLIQNTLKIPTITP